MRFDEVASERVRAAGNPGAASRCAASATRGSCSWTSRPGYGWSVLAYGQTTNLDSRHSSDQLPLFASRRLRRAWYTEADRGQPPSLISA